MEKILAVLAVAAAGVALLVYLTVLQLRRRRGDDSHQRRGVGILALLLLVLYILEGGLRSTAFRSEVMSFRIHMAFALPTAAVLVALAITGVMGRKGSSEALELHRFLNKPAGSGAMLWLTSSIVTGLAFVGISLAH